MSESIIDRRDTVSLADVGLRTHVAGTAYTADGIPHLVLGKLGADKSDIYDPLCESILHEKTGPLPPDILARIHYPTTEGVNPMTESPTITRAKRALEQLGRKAEQSSDKPVGVITISDILAAEQRLATAQAEFRDYQSSDDYLRETLDKDGRRGLAVDKRRLERIDHLREKVQRQQLALESVKREWLGALIREER